MPSPKSSTKNRAKKRPRTTSQLGSPTTSSERRDGILRSAGELFAIKGIAGTTVRDIGEASSMLAGSLYHHFASKDAIVAEIMERYLKEIRSRVTNASAASTDPVEALRRMVRETLMLIDEHPHATAIYHNDKQYLHEHGLLDQLEEVSTQVRSLWVETIESGVAQGSLRSDIPPTVIYQSIRDTLWSTPWWPTRDDYATDDLVDLLSTLFLEGSLAPRTGTSTTGD